MTIENLDRAVAVAKQVLAGVTPDQLADPTPCASWDVRTLLNHLVGGTYYFGSTIEAGEAPLREATDYASGDFMASFDEGSARAVVAFNAPGALEKTVKLPYGEFSGPECLALTINETFTHAWDLAKATGQSTDLDPELATALLDAVAMPDEIRGDEPMPFGPRQDAGPNATAADRYAAYVGRTVHG